MGTDLHAFIEVDYGSNAEPFGAGAEVRAFNGGEFFICRSYDLFDALGDGRNYHFSEDEIENHSLFAPRGLPTQCSHAVENRYFHLVDDGGHNITLEPSLPTITNETADRWLREGKAVLGPPLEIWGRIGREELRRVSNPIWHSPSWLTLKEIYQSLDHFGLALKELNADFRCIVSVMTQFEAELGIRRTRLVFWFDN